MVPGGQGPQAMWSKWLPWYQVLHTWETLFLRKHFDLIYIKCNIYTYIGIYYIYKVGSVIQLFHLLKLCPTPGCTLLPIPSADSQ